LNLLLGLQAECLAVDMDYGHPFLNKNTFFKTLKLVAKAALLVYSLIIYKTFNHHQPKGDQHSNHGTASLNTPPYPSLDRGRSSPQICARSFPTRTNPLKHPSLN
jgi:hypothetical protein